MRCRHRLSKLLLRHGIVYDDGKAWSELHDRWLRHQRFDAPATQAAFDDAYETVLLAKARRDRLEEKITAIAGDSEFTGARPAPGLPAGHLHVDRFRAGGRFGDWQRFTGASIGAYLGLVPSEHSSGQSRSQGPITKTGNTHVRRLLIEAAWHHRTPYRPSVVLQRRWDQADAVARARGHAGNQRLHSRWVTYNLRKKRGVVANVAIARELSGWCWSLAVLPD